MTETLATVINRMDETALYAALERCCGASRWIVAMIASRPFADDDAVYEAAETHWAQMQREDILEAMAHHPRIGADLNALRAKFAPTKAWSGDEQAGVTSADEATLRALRDGNAEYDERFGHVFLVCATGKSAAEMLTLLRARMHNAHDDELQIAAVEHMKITRIRLDKLASEQLEEPS